MRYKVDDKYFDEYEEAIDYCIEERWHEDDDYFKEWVNDTYGSIEINGDWYSAYDILDNMDSSNLDSLLDDFCERMNEDDKDEARYELKRADVGEEIYVHNSTIIVVDDEEDCDGDKAIASIENLRNFIEEQKILKEIAENEEKKNEDDFMSLFQVISG